MWGCIVCCLGATEDQRCLVSATGYVQLFSSMRFLLRLINSTYSELRRGDGGARRNESLRRPASCTKEISYLPSAASNPSGRQIRGSVGIRDEDAARRCRRDRHSPPSVGEWLEAGRLAAHPPTRAAACQVAAAPSPSLPPVALKAGWGGACEGANQEQSGHPLTSYGCVLRLGCRPVELRALPSPCPSRLFPA